jgi:hypothetical protein
MSLEGAVVESEPDIHCRQRLGKDRLKAGIVEPDTELPILLGNASCAFPRQGVYKQTVTTHTRNWTLELGGLYSVGRR